MSIKVNGKIVAGRGKPGVGVPAGGAQGQVLTKRSATDYDTYWATPTGGGGGDTPIVQGGGFVEMTTSIPTSERSPNVLYALVLKDYG